MATFAAMLFGEQLDQVVADPEAGRWGIERQGDETVLHVTLSPASAPEELFLVKLAWDDFPGRIPASVIFLDAETREKGAAQAWPSIPGVRAPNDICACWTAEGYGAHPEWLNDPKMLWHGGDNAILTQLRYLQLELDAHYNGRCQ